MLRAVGGAWFPRTSRLAYKSMLGCLASRPTSMDIPEKKPTENSSFVRRWVYVSAGLVCVSLGGVGVFLPLMPTVVFLMLACFFFARSVPHLEHTLVRNRFFAPFLPLLDGKRSMTNSAKLTAIGVLWVCAGISCYLLIVNPLIPVWPIGVVIAINLIATYIIARL